MLANFNKVLKDHWRNLINGFWFVPGLVSLLGPLLALFFLSLDHHVGREDQIFLFSGGAAEASTILSTIAGSLITVVGLTFSITIVVLQLVSSQYTPRALRGFLRDRITQVVAGGFAAISAYCLIVLTTVQDSSSPDHSFLPAISITVAMGLGFLGLERRSRNGKEEVDRTSQRWLAQEKRTGKAEADATITLATPSRTFRARRADCEKDSESQIIYLFA